MLAQQCLWQLERFKGEFLAPYGKLIHEAARGMHKGGHAIDIIGFSLDARFWTGTGAGAGTSGSDPGLRPCSNSDRLGWDAR